MNIVFTCGGTGGHIYPAIAVARMFRERQPDCRILFIGAEDGMENKLVPREGFELQTVQISNYQRKLTPAAIWHNLVTVQRMSATFAKTKRILKDFQPDVIVGTGGYASFPALEAARRLHIPTCVHESNAMPGLTTRMVADWVDRVLICFPESAKHYRHPEKAEVVGMPVRREFLFNERAKARKALGIGEDEWVVLSAFGSQGAREMNYAVGRMMALEQADGFPFRHIHAVGSYGWDWMGDFVKDQGVDLAKAPRIEMKEYLYNMPTVMAAADVMISRAGASTCNEIAAAGIPCVLIPSPNVTDNHQEKNARALERGGGAEVLLEKDCTAQALYGLVTDLLKDPEKRRGMRAALHKMAVPDSAERICDILDRLAAGKQ